MEKIVSLLVLLSLFNSADTFFQAVVGNLKGQVIDEHKAPLASANIALVRNYGNYESRQVRLNFTYRFADSTENG